VCELDTNLLALGVCELNDPAKRLHLRVFPETAVLWGNPSLGLYRSSLNECEARTALDDAAQMCEVPVGLVAIFGRVLAERRKSKAVLNREAAKLEGLEELGDLGAAIEHAKGGSGDGLLCRSEV
jgi:hypothetical protein